MCLWYSDEYVWYATVIVVTSVVSLISEVYQMHRNQVALSNTIQTADTIQVGEKMHYICYIKAVDLIMLNILWVFCVWLEIKLRAYALAAGSLITHLCHLGPESVVGRTITPGQTSEVELNFSQSYLIKKYIFEKSIYVKLIKLKINGVSSFYD